MQKHEGISQIEYHLETVQPQFFQNPHPSGREMFSNLGLSTAIVRSKTSIIFVVHCNFRKLGQNMLFVMGNVRQLLETFILGWWW